MDKEIKLIEINDRRLLEKLSGICFHAVYKENGVEEAEVILGLTRDTKILSCHAKMYMSNTFL